MAQGKPIGTIFAELDLDSSRYTRAQQTLLRDATAITLNIEQNFKNLGIKSSAEMDLMRQKIQNSYNMIANNAKATANDILRAEEAKNAKLRALDEMQFGRQTSMMTSLKNNYLAVSASIAATIYSLERIARPFIAVFEKGFQAVETYSQSVASLSAMVVTFSERAKGQDLAGQWQEALKYSTAMVPVLESLAAKTLLSGQETTALANAFARSGVFLDANNAKQVEGFTRLSNALPLMTQGQEIMRQINTEIRATMTGQGAASSMLLTTLKAIDPELEKHLKTWRAEGTVLEHVGDLLEGFGPATELLENQWQAVKTTIDTTATQILRGIMKPAYEEIIDSAKRLNEWMVTNKQTILDWATSFRINLISLQAEALRLAMLLDKAGGTMSSAQMLLYGPGAALGIESSQKRFEAAAERNMEYQRRYEESNKRLQELANLQIKLEESLGKGANADLSAAGTKFKPLAQGLTEAELEKAKQKAEQIERLNEQIRIRSAKAVADTYEEEINAMNLQADKYRKLGAGKIEVEMFVASETERIRNKYASKSAEDLKRELRMWYENAQEKIRIDNRLQQELLSIKGKTAEMERAQFEALRQSSYYQNMTPEQQAIQDRISRIKIFQASQRDQNPLYESMMNTAMMRANTPDIFGGISEKQQEDQYEIEYKRRAKALDDKINLEREKNGELSDLYQQYLDERNAMEQQYNVQSRANAVERFNSQLELLGSSFGKMAGVMDQHNKKQFMAYKAFAIAQAMIDTYSAAMKAYKEGGPYMGPVLAAMAVAFGVMQVAKIASQKYEGRQFGGSTLGNRMYEVNETKQPELLTMNGRQYLLPTQADGYITPARQVNTGSKGIVVNLYDYGTKKNYDVQQFGENEIRIIARDEAKMAVNDHAPRVIAGEISEPNSKVSKALNRSTMAGRKR